MGERELIQDWMWQQFIHNAPLDQPKEFRSCISQILAELGASKYVFSKGGAEYHWWDVVPNGWIDGRRSLNNELLQQLTVESFEMGDWKWQAFDSLSSAVMNLLFVHRNVEITGVLGEETGYLEINAERWGIPGCPEKGGMWQWKASNPNDRCGPGWVGVRLYDISAQALEAGSGKALRID